MNITNIHWHDCEILQVVICTAERRVRMTVLYPDDWANNQFSKRDIVFDDAYRYQEWEGLIVGSPTILEATTTVMDECWYQVRLVTNAGFREVYCQNVYLCQTDQKP